MSERDFDATPYDPNEKRVCDYLRRITDDMVGCGDDPIGFLIASHASLTQRKDNPSAPSGERRPTTQAEFDAAFEEFTRRLTRAANWKESYFGAAYSTRLLEACEEVEDAARKMREMIRRDRER